MNQFYLYLTGSVVAAIGCYKTKHMLLYLPFSLYGQTIIGREAKVAFSERFALMIAGIMGTAVPIGLGFISYKCGKKVYYLKNNLP